MLQVEKHLRPALAVFGEYNRLGLADYVGDEALVSSRFIVPVKGFPGSAVAVSLKVKQRQRSLVGAIGVDVLVFVAT